MTVTGVVSAILVGAILGVLGRLVAPGKQTIPIWLTVLVGIVAAIIGTALVGTLRDTNGFDWIELIVQVALAGLGVVIAARMYPQGGRH